MLAIIFYIPLAIAIYYLVKSLQTEPVNENRPESLSADEKTIIISKQGTIAKKVAIGLVAIGGVLFLLMLMRALSGTFYSHTGFFYFFTSVIPYFGSMTILPATILAVLEYVGTIKCSITVTDKRVYGIALFGKRVDLPIDSISAVGKSILKGIAVGTASGKIHFFNIDNQDEMHEAISRLLINRQQATRNNSAAAILQEVPKSSADELIKYKELLDAGVITEQEFDAKKKQILGL